MTRWAVIFGLVLAACHSPGPYGHAKTYVPLSEEEEAAAGAEPYDPVMARRARDQWRGRKVSLFGVVTDRAAGRDGMTTVRLSMRRLEPRNLCETAAEESCRVTVSDRPYADVVARVELRPRDDLGKRSLRPGSLVRVIGRLTGKTEDGSPMISAEYYRHWPRGFYVTTASRRFMKR